MLGLERETDENVWEYAKSNGYTIVTQDSDFYDRSLMYGHPPKIIWITTGNVATSRMKTILTTNSKIIGEFDQNPELACLELY